MVRHDYRDRYQSATKAIQALQNLTHNRSDSTIINQEESQISFKLVKKILLFGGITSIVIASIKVRMNNFASPT
jgi:hypothetical protein